MSTAWTSVAERLSDSEIGGAMDKPDAPARVVWHTTKRTSHVVSFASFL